MTRERGVTLYAQAPAPLIVNCTGDTLTASGSGGIGTWVLGVSAAARVAGVDVRVLTKRHPHLPAALSDAVVLDYPHPPSLPGLALLDRSTRRWLGHRHMAQPLWNARVTRFIGSLGPAPRSLIFNNDPELAVVVARRFKQHRVLHMLHNTDGFEPRWHGAFRDHVVPLAISDFIARWLERHCNLDPGVVATVHNGVDINAFVPAKKCEGRVVISYVGLFNERKAPDLLLDAALRLAGSVPLFEVRLIGSTHYGRAEVDAYGESLILRASELRAAGVQVSMPGFLDRDALARQLSTTDVIVVPSRCEEAFSLVALEGMASGAAAVVAGIGGLPEAVGTAGTMFHPGDSASLAAALSPLVSDPALLLRQQRFARTWATTKTWDQTWRGLGVHM